MPKRALGKGLSALIPSLQGNEKHQIVEVDVESLKPNPYQPRTEVDEESLDNLAESIKKHGLIQPIVVRQKEDFYEIVAGERRYRAAIKANLKKVPVIVKNVGDEESALVALVENLQRENLNPLEEAVAFKNLQEKFNLTQEQIAEKIGLSRSAVANTLRILSLPDEIKRMIIKKEISRGHAVALSGLPSESLQIEAAKSIVKNSLSVREAERLVNLLKSQKLGSRKVRNDISTDLKSLEEEITRRTELKTRIKIKKSKIEIVLSAGTIDEVNSFISKLGG
ncbi:MAG: ParB/RepB/Spo0J family partition protein [Actinobacteria bacterium]|nr:ParB/RepB/Spo0J family partition protein [Actinomycetota bacterium]